MDCNNLAPTSIGYEDLEYPTTKLKMVPVPPSPVPKFGTQPTVTFLTVINNIIVGLKKFSSMGQKAKFVPHDWWIFN